MRVHCTDHCVARYHERVRPGVELAQARRELEALAQASPVSEEFPVWAKAPDYVSDAVLDISGNWPVSVEAALRLGVESGRYHRRHRQANSRRHPPADR